MEVQQIRSELAWLLYGWSLPAGTELPDELSIEEFALWETKARGVLSLLGDKLDAAGHADAAKLLTRGKHQRPGSRPGSTSPSVTCP